MRPTGFFKQKLFDEKGKKRQKTTDQEEIEVSPERPKNLQGKKVAISGVLKSITRESLEDVIKENGGVPVKSVSKCTNILIKGDLLEDGRSVESGRKHQNAVKFNVLIINELEFQEFMQKILKNPNYKLGNGWLSIQGTNNEEKEEWKSKDGTDDKSNNSQENTQPTDKRDSLGKTKLIYKQKINNEQIKKSHDGSSSTSDKRKDEELNKKSPKTEELRNISWKSWIDKHAPKSSRDLIGNIKQISLVKEWLNDWDDVILNGNKKEIKITKGQKYSNIPKVNARAVIISGPPGIGKTAAATIICKEMGYQIISINASDTRNKKSIEDMLTDLSTNTTIQYYQKLTHDPNEKLKSVIIMDEVDGVGANDRGGIGALIQVIKSTRTPVIWIWNDIRNRKLTPLINYWYDIRFDPPTSDQIVYKWQEIWRKEDLYADQFGLKQIVEANNCDIRHTLNTLQLWKYEHHTVNKQKTDSKIWQIKKDMSVQVNAQDVATIMLNQNEFKKIESFKEKLNLFFIHYDLVPLYIHENYLTSMWNSNSMDSIENLAKSADMISKGDVVLNQTRSSQDWSLMPSIGILSCLGPATLVWKFCSFVKFPEWMGKYSTSKKYMRLTRELWESLGYKVGSISKDAIQHEFTPLIFDQIMNFLEKGDKESMNEAVKILTEYNISIDMLKDNIMSIIEPERAKRYENLNKTLKTNFTKLYKSETKSSVAPQKKKTIVGESSSLGGRFNPDAEEEKEVENDSEGDSDPEFKVKDKSSQSSTRRSQPKRSSSIKSNPSVNESDDEQPKEKKKQGKKKAKDNSKGQSKNNKEKSGVRNFKQYGRGGGARGRGRGK